MSPLCGRRLRSAWSRAAWARARSFVALVAQPTTRLENRSSSTAKYSHPSAVARYVTSPTQALLGAVASKVRASTLGTTGRSWRESVVARVGRAHEAALL